jgi:REP element-mobilizing transposase RayT
MKSGACNEFPSVFQEFPLAYHITFNCYGRRLHGDAEGSIERHGCNYPGLPCFPPSKGMVEFELETMTQPPYEMDAPRRKAVLQAIIEVGRYRGWQLLAVHVRSSHVHIVVRSIAPPEKVMNDFKAYASRRLNRDGFENKKRKRWSRHGSTQYKWTLEQVQSTVHYVLHEQGDPMETYGEG